MQVTPGFNRPPIAPQSVASKMIKGTDWMEVKTNVGSCFWHNKRTGESTWVLPKEVKTAMSEPPVPKLDAKRLKMLERAKASGAVIAPKYAALVGAGPKALTDGRGKAGNFRNGVQDEDEDVDVTFTEDDINEGIHHGGNKESTPKVIKDLKDTQNQFYEMLRQHNVHEFSRYEKEVSKFQTDERFLAIPASQRRSMFEEYCTMLGRSNQESSRSRKRQYRETTYVDRNQEKDAGHGEDAYKAVLHERITQSDIPFSAIPQSDSRTQGVCRSRQEELYKLHVKTLRRAEDLRRQAERRGRHLTREIEDRQQEAGVMEAMAHFVALLAESVRDARLSWSEAWPVLLEDPQGRATNPLLDKVEAEQAFYKRIEALRITARNDFVEMVKEVADKRAEGFVCLLNHPLEIVGHELEELVREDGRYVRLPVDMRQEAWDTARRELNHNAKAAPMQELEGTVEGEEKKDEDEDEIHG
jgi:hypothetical protein